MKKLIFSLVVVLLTIPVFSASNQLYNRVGKHTLTFLTSVYKDTVYSRDSKQYTECKSTAYLMKDVSGIEEQGFTDIFTIALDFSANQGLYGRQLGRALALDGYVLVKTASDGYMADILIFSNAAHATVATIYTFGGPSVFMPDAKDGDICIVVYGLQ